MSPTPLSSPPQASGPQFTFAGYAAETTFPVVGFWPRAGARIIDMIVINLTALFSGVFFAIVIGIAAAVGKRPHGWLEGRLSGFSFVGLLFGLIGSLLFHTTCEALHGSSPGKLMLGQVVLSEGGTPCGVKAAFGRSCAYFVDALFFGAVGYFAMSGSPLLQRNGDKWFHTVVCKRSEVDPAMLRSGGRFLVALLIALVLNAGMMGLGLIARLVL
jgi:hypothetical protein